MGEWNTAYLGSRVRAEGTKTFAFERPPDFEYAPGQFFFVMLDSPSPMEHHFSFSSAPTEPNIEFTTRMTGSEFKNRLDQLDAGQSAHLAGPDGAFVVQERMRKVAFVCGGIGITPARSTIRWALDSQANLDIVLLYANRDLQSVAFREEFDAIDAENVRVVNVLSQPETGWDGRSGRVDEDVVRQEVPDWDERDFFVSGPPVMCVALAELLVEGVGIPADRLITEHFPGYT